MLESVKPKSSISRDINYINKVVTRVQAVWRGYITRKRYLKLRETDLRQVGKSFSRVTSKGVSFKDDSADDRQGAAKKPSQMTPDERKAEAEKKKKLMLAQNKAKKKKSETLESKMNTIVKPGKEKVNDKQMRMREELSNYIKNVLLEDIITVAQCYGESLLVGRSI